MVELGVSFSTIKSLLIFFAPIIIPRIINLYRNVRTALSTRPAPQPLPANASRALNILFCMILVCLVLSLPFSPYAPDPSVFWVTRSRFNTPTEIIFSRLARHRTGGVLTATDKLLKSKLTGPIARRVYLRFGGKALTDCQFCTFDNVNTFVLYYLPFNTLIPHLLHMLVIGVATSAPVAGRDAAGWRGKFTFAGLVLAAVDIYAMFTFDPVQSGPASVRDGITTPAAVFQRMAVLRPLSFAIFDALCAGLIYISATKRWFFEQPTQADQVEQVVQASLAALSGASTKLHALSVTRNAVVRDKVLKDRDDAYWRTVVAMGGSKEASHSGGSAGEGLTPSSIWEEEEVVKAMSQAMAGQGGVDMAKLGVDAAQYVNGITAGLDNNHRSQEA